MNSLRELRADVIEKFINIEIFLTAILSQFYFGRVRKDFVFDFLYDEYCSFALKRRVLFKVAPELRSVPQFEQDLNRLNTIRNYFAHLRIWVSPPDADGPQRIPDPRNFERSVDFQALYEEFCKKAPRVVDVLVEQFKKLGGEIEDVKKVPPTSSQNN